MKIKFLNKSIKNINHRFFVKDKDIFYNSGVFGSEIDIKEPSFIDELTLNFNWDTRPATNYFALKDGDSINFYFIVSYTFRGGNVWNLNCRLDVVASFLSTLNFSSNKILVSRKHCDRFFINTSTGTPNIEPKFSEDYAFTEEYIQPKFSQIVKTVPVDAEYKGWNLLNETQKEFFRKLFFPVNFLQLSPEWFTETNVAADDVPRILNSYLSNSSRLGWSGVILSPTSDNVEGDLVAKIKYGNDTLASNWEVLGNINAKYMPFLKYAFMSPMPYGDFTITAPVSPDKTINLNYQTSGLTASVLLERQNIYPPYLFNMTNGASHNTILPNYNTIPSYYAPTQDDLNNDVWNEDWNDPKLLNNQFTQIQIMAITGESMILENRGILRYNSIFIKTTQLYDIEAIRICMTFYDANGLLEPYNDVNAKTFYSTYTTQIPISNTSFNDFMVRNRASVNAGKNNAAVNLGIGLTTSLVPFAGFAGKLWGMASRKVWDWNLNQADVMGWDKETVEKYTAMRNRNNEIASKPWSSVIGGISSLYSFINLGSTIAQYVGEMNRREALFEDLKNQGTTTSWNDKSIVKDLETIRRTKFGNTKSAILFNQPDVEEKKMINQYFHRFGYSYGRYDTINDLEWFLHGRKHFGYTMIDDITDALEIDNLSVILMEEFKNVFSQGVCIWRNPEDIENFTKSNWELSILPAQPAHDEGERHEPEY